MSNLINLCGEPPEDYSKVDINNDPSFIFKIDEDFVSRILYDIEGNAISVNSFQECEHYFSGGWGYEPSITKEYMLQTNLSYLVVLTLILSLFIKKFQFLDRK